MAARRTVKILTASAAVLASGVFAGSAIALASSSAPAHKGHVKHLQVRQILSGASLSHTFVPSGSTTKTDPLKGPDDITRLGDRLFVGFQNGVGAQGEPATDGNTFSTVVEFTGSGKVIKQWDVQGKVDGLGADPWRRDVIATVNEDGNSSLDTIAPWAPSAAQVVHYAYNKPLPHFGGTDAVTADRGTILVSASAPGTTGGSAAPQPAYPAVYAVRLDRHTQVATVRAVFYDEASARLANKGAGAGKVVKLGLTDPDSNAVVPHSARRFGGAFELDSQGDLQQIFVTRHGFFGYRLSVLNLAQSIDDSAWTLTHGRLYATDSSANAVDVVTGTFPRGAELAAVTPCNANSAPSTCPAPGFSANYLGWVNQWTGAITPVSLSGPAAAAFQPKGLVFARADRH